MLQQGETEEGVRQLDAALSLSGPDLRKQYSARVELLNGHLRAGNRDQAREQLSWISAKVPRDPNIPEYRRRLERLRPQ